MTGSGRGPRELTTDWVPPEPGRGIRRDDPSTRLLRLLSAKHSLGVLVSVVLAILLLAGLHPFNFSPGNQVSWSRDGQGVRFLGYGEVLGIWGPIKEAPNTSAEVPNIALEFWATSSHARVEAAELNQMFSVYQSEQAEPFAIDEWKTDLEISGVFQNDHGAKFQRIGVTNVFTPTRPRFVTITSSEKGTAIYLEGVLQKNYPGLVLKAENFEGTLLLGQTLQGRQEWYGDVLGLAIYWQTLAPEQVAKHYLAWRSADWEALRLNGPAAIYPFNEGSGNVVHNRGDIGQDLAIPRKLKALDPVILAMPKHDDFTNLSDVVLNLGGFIPLGLLLVLYLKNFGWADRNASVAAVALGLVVSLAIELLQALLPSRDSSLLDVINNTVGTGIGAWLAIRVIPWVQKIHLPHEVRR